MQHFKEQQLPDYTEKFGGSISTAMKKLGAGMILPESGVLCRSARTSKETGHDVFFFLSTETSNKDTGKASLFAKARGIGLCLI